MGSPSEDLARWIPCLLAVWRAGKRAPRRDELPGHRLAPDELKEVAAGVRRLSQGLTRERELAGARYMDDPRLLGAYLLFYWPVSYLQGRTTLSELPGRPRAALDLGSGPGPLAFAALDAGAAEVTAADRSAPALELARKLAGEAGEALATRNWDPTKQRPLSDVRPAGSLDLVTLGHVLNELFEGDVDRRARLCEDALALLKPGGTLLVVEPALKETSRKLLAVRDVLVRRGYAVRAPCLWRGDCPALVKESDWCHAEREIEPPALVADLARAAGLHKEAVKMSYLAVAPKGEAWPEPPQGRVFRIVSEPLPSKGRLRYMGCGPEGRLGLALQEKHVVPENRAFQFLKRGDVVRLTEAEPRGDGLALSDKSEVRVIAPAGKPVVADDRDDGAA